MRFCIHSLTSVLYLCVNEVCENMIIIVKLIIPHLSLFKSLSGYRQHGQVGISEHHPHVHIYAEIK